MPITYKTTVSGTRTNGTAIAGSTNSIAMNADNVIEGNLIIPSAAPATLLTVAAAVAGATLTTLSKFYLKNQADPVANPTHIIEVGILTATDTVYKKVPPGEEFLFVGNTIDTNAAAAASSTYIAVVSINAKALAGTPQAYYIAH